MASLNFHIPTALAPGMMQYIQVSFLRVAFRFRFWFGGRALQRVVFFESGRHSFLFFLIVGSGNSLLLRVLFLLFSALLKRQSAFSLSQHLSPAVATRI